MKTIFEIYESILKEGSIKASMKYYPDFSEEELTKIASADPDWNEKNPDRTGNFGRWLFDTSTRMKKNGEFSFDELDEVKRLLKLAKINKINIQKAKSFDNLKELVDGEKSSGKQFSTKKAAENYSVFKKAEKLGMKILLDDDDYVFGVPETFESSKVFGEDIGGRKISKWCTTTKNMYEHYNNMGPLFIIMRKNDGDLFQIHTETYSMMDENDEFVDYFDIFQNDEKIDLFQKCVYDYLENKNELRRNELKAKLFKNYYVTNDDVDIINELKLSELVVPNNITYVGYSAFRDCTTLISVVLPNGLKEIGECAFKNCEHLTSIFIPNSVVRIGNYSFSDCTDLTSIVLPYKLSKIEKHLFSRCNNLTSISIPDGVTAIGEDSFYNCKSLKSISIPDNVTSIGKESFCNCESLESISIPDNVTSIGERAFSGCDNLKSINIPDNLSKIGKHAFSGCNNLNSIFIPDGIKKIEEGLFFHCESLKSVSLSDGVTAIGPIAFYECINLNSIVIPKNVVRIGMRVFYSCKSLKKVLFKGKSLTEIKNMKNYPWGIKNPENVIKAELS